MHDTSKLISLVGGRGRERRRAGRQHAVLFAVLSSVGVGGSGMLEVGGCSV